MSYNPNVPNSLTLAYIDLRKSVQTRQFKFMDGYANFLNMHGKAKYNDATLITKEDNSIGSNYICINVLQKLKDLKI